ncbi:hypothetical protein GCM10010954_10410 [Halobacillus andaensis]|uniref:Uncharacterized protein n=1 Tax=Halobacillus andaensis TaxID=1176239 RepID=A0A917B2G4_HALAA|nr:hypothetical protein [Halobacillus andaensis]MBP2003833.1 hypothetical protein [Halobacillus andaensis]GGF13598.1 hypothetical protein GCM10010954_10410 [Halobacillus andaensis]
MSTSKKKIWWGIGAAILAIYLISIWQYPYSPISFYKNVEVTNAHTYTEEDILKPLDDVWESDEAIDDVTVNRLYIMKNIYDFDWLYQESAQLPPEELMMAEVRVEQSIDAAFSLALYQEGYDQETKSALDLFVTNLQHLENELRVTKDDEWASRKELQNRYSSIRKVYRQNAQSFKEFYNVYHSSRGA